MTDAPALVPAPRYQAHYCEENIWHLCAHPELSEAVCQVVFITNTRQAVPFWHQRAASPGQYIVWDYHVVLLVKASDRWQVWDLDSRLEVPLPLGEYLRATFANLRHVEPDFWPRFRVVAADEYRQHFSSDRSHMRDADGAYLAEPPGWPPILRPELGMNLHRFRDLDTPFLGRVVDLALLAAWFNA